MTSVSYTVVEPGRVLPAHLAEAPGGIPEPHAKKIPVHILVVDDEPLIRWSVAETLAELGMQVEQASDAASALETLSSVGLPFDVIVLDLRLPDTRDLSLVAAIRKQAPEASVVLMTAFSTPEIVASAHEMGVVDVLKKPFELRELSRVVLGAGGPVAS